MPLLTEIEFSSWCSRLSLSREAEEIVRKIRSSPPARKVRQNKHSVPGFYSSRKMGCTIQFESHTVEFPHVYSRPRYPTRTVVIIAWCLTVEPMFGISDNQPLCFPEAVRDRIDLGDGVPRTVSSSGCSLVLKHSDGRTLKISRAIKGDCSVVDVEELAVDTEAPGQPLRVLRASKLSARSETMSDATGGFQHFFFEWLGWPRERVATFRSSSDLYLENLAPLFDIDQAEGWTNVQALQISRYGQQKITEIAVEYLLGATAAISNRFLHQQAEQRDRSLRDEARQITQRVEKTFLRNGWNVSWSSHGSVASVIERWSKQKVKAVLKDEANVDLPQSQRSVLDRIEKLRNALVKEPLNPAKRTVPGLREYLAIERKRVPGDILFEADRLECQLFAGYDPYFEGDEPPGL